MNTAVKINPTNINKIAKNIQFLLNIHNLSENQLAQSINLPVMTIRRLVSGETIDPRISTLKLIATYFNISVDSLIEDNSFNPLMVLNKITPQFVPILDWVTAATITSINKIDRKTWQTWHPIILSEQTNLESAFALESRPSMQPRFPLGTLLIVDPTITPTDGDIVLIRSNFNGNISFREISIDIPHWQLNSLIVGYEPIFYDAQQYYIVGVVILTFFQPHKEK